MANKPVKTVEGKLRFVVEELKENANIAELCCRHDINQTNLYNRVRRHSSLGYKSPVAFEQQQRILA